MAKRKRLPRATRLSAVWETRPQNVQVGTANTSKPTIHISAKESDGVKIDSMSVSFHGGCGSMLRQVKNRRCNGARATADVEFRTNTEIIEGPLGASMLIRLHKKNTDSRRYRDGVTPHAEYTEEIVSADVLSARRAAPKASTGGMSMEYVIVRFPEDREVLVDGKANGVTNQIIRVKAGRRRFTLKGAKDYRPNWRRPNVTATTAHRPLDVCFEKV